MTAPIALVTDFGRLDPYVGLIEAVMHGVLPDARVFELTHDLAPGDVSAGAFWLDRCRPYFAAGTVFLGVIDPGVGTERRPLAVRVGAQFFVGPDNGLFTDVLAHGESSGERIQAVTIDVARLGPLAPAPRGNTFHGRDLFAPAAALLAGGAPLVSLGAPEDLRSLVRTEFTSKCPAPLTVADKPATVRVVDRFGNLITDRSWLGDHDPGVSLGGRRLPWVRTYGDAKPGTLVALRGSFDTVEVAVSQGSAAAVVRRAPFRAPEDDPPG